MLTTSCPKCEKEVTVPSGAKADSRVRCPLCSDEYTLENVFADLPPLLELLDAPAANGAVASTDTTSTDAAPTDETSPDEGTDAGGGMFDFDQGAGAGDAPESDDGDLAIGDPVQTVSKSSGFEFSDGAPAAASVGGSATGARAARPRKKSASPVKAIIGVIIGGLFAIPIAQLTLWYLPGGWDIEQRDPMGVGRKLSGSFASFIVPSWVTNPDGATDTAGPVEPAVEPSTTANNNPPNQTLDPEDEPGGLGGMLGTAHSGNNGGNHNGNRNNGNRNNGNRNNGNRNNGNRNNGNGNSNGSNASNNGGGEDNPPDDGADGNSGSDPEDASTKPGVINPPIHTPTELADELKLAKEHVDNYDKVSNENIDGGEKITLLKEAFSALSQLALVTTFTEDKPDGHREHLDDMLLSAGSTLKKRQALAITALSKIKDKGRENNGVVIAGKIKKIEKMGPLFETVIECETSSRPPVSVYGTRNPAGAFSEGDTVMVLGVIYDEPVKDIRDFKGPREESIIWGGYSQVIPTADDE